MLAMVKESFGNLWRGERTAILAAILGVVSMLLVIVACARGQYPYQPYPTIPTVPLETAAVQGEYKWYAHAGNHNQWTLWRGNQLVGVLDPDLAQWQFPWEKEPQDLTLKLDDYWRAKGQPRTNTGTLKKASTIGQLVPEKKEDKPKPKARVCECDDCDCDPCKCNVGGEPTKVEGLIDGRQVDGGVTKMFPNYGVNHSEIARDRVGYSLNGRPVGAAEAMDAIREGTIPNDSDLPRLVIIGNEAKRKQVLSDLDHSPDLAPFKNKLLVQAYNPGHWHVSPERGFIQPTGDEPVIQLQNANGKVLWRQTNYNGGAPELAKSLRDKVPGYDPKLDPQPKNANGGDGSLPFNPLWLLAAAGGGLVLWRMRK